MQLIYEGYLWLGSYFYTHSRRPLWAGSDRISEISALDLLKAELMQKISEAERLSFILTQCQEESARIILDEEAAYHELNQAYETLALDYIGGSYDEASVEDRRIIQHVQDFDRIEEELIFLERQLEEPEQIKLYKRLQKKSQHMLSRVRSQVPFLQSSSDNESGPKDRVAAVAKERHYKLQSLGRILGTADFGDRALLAEVARFEAAWRKVNEAHIANTQATKTCRDALRDLGVEEPIIGTLNRWNDRIREVDHRKEHFLYGYGERLASLKQLKDYRDYEVMEHLRLIDEQKKALDKLLEAMDRDEWVLKVQQTGVELEAKHAELIDYLEEHRQLIQKIKEKEGESLHIERILGELYASGSRVKS